MVGTRPESATLPRTPFRASRALANGLAAWRSRLPLLFGVAAVVVLFNVPASLVQAMAVSRTQEVAARAEARGDRPPEPEEAIADLQALGPVCCGLCGSLLLGVFLAAPVTAGATVAGARCVRGNARLGDAFAGFRPGRYLPTLSATLVTILVGGGAAVLVIVVQAVSVAGAASQAVGSMLGPRTVIGVALALALVTLWLSARLWFAVTRAADPDRPRVGGMSAVGRSWAWTEGAAQWGVLALVVPLAAATAVLVVPAGMLGAAAVPAQLVAAAAAATLWMAVLGAAYEELADANEPRPDVAGPDAQGVASGEADGGMAG